MPRWPRGFARWPWFLLRLGGGGAGRATGALRVWLWWERLTRRWWGVRGVRPGGVVAYSVRRHRGAPVLLEDGTRVAPGDRIVELHLENPALLGLTSSQRWHPVQGIRAASADLAMLGERVLRGDLGDVRALHGVTLFSAAAARGGFEVRPLPRSWRWAIVRFFLVGLRVIYRPSGRERPRPREAVWPAEVWMSPARAATLARDRPL